jgi:hypothetical protein
MKSTVYTLSSTHPSAMTVAHVPLFSALVRNTGSLLSPTPGSALGESRAPATIHGAEGQASQTQTRSLRQVLLGHRSPVLVRLEAVSHYCYAGDRGALASCWLSHVLEPYLQGEEPSRAEEALEGCPESDLPDGGAESELGRSPNSWRTSHAGLRCVRANYLPLDEASTQRSRLRSPMA